MTEAGETSSNGQSVNAVLAGVIVDLQEQLYHYSNMADIANAVGDGVLDARLIGRLEKELSQAPERLTRMVDGVCRRVRPSLGHLTIALEWSPWSRWEAVRTRAIPRESGVYLVRRREGCGYSDCRHERDLQRRYRCVRYIGEAMNLRARMMALLNVQGARGIHEAGDVIWAEGSQAAHELCWATTPHHKEAERLLLREHSLGRPELNKKG